MRFMLCITLIGTVAVLAGQNTPAPSEVQAESANPTYGLLTPIPEAGGLPPIYSKMYEATPQELERRAKVRDYAKQLRQIRKQHFGRIKVEKTRAAGMAQLREFTDPAAFEPMIKELAREEDDVRLAMLQHFATQGAEGQAALARVAIYDKDNAIRNEAMRRMTRPVDQPALYVIDRALRSKNAEHANAGAVLVNTLNVIQAIPLLIFAQASGTASTEQPGDLAWIAIETQHAYVAGLQPVAGNGVAGFQPILGVVSEGAILRVVDAVVIEYRTVVNGSLMNMTTRDWGQSTESMGYNIKAWWDWYNNVYLPFKISQVSNQNNHDLRSN